MKAKVVAYILSLVLYSLHIFFFLLVAAAAAAAGTYRICAFIYSFQSLPSFLLFFFLSFAFNLI